MIDADAAAAGLYAGWSRRFVAWAVDGALVLAAAYAADRAGLPFGVGGIFLTGAVYDTLCHGSRRGQTAGKALVRISVRDDASLGRLSYSRSFARWLVTALLWAVILLPGAIDALVPLGSAKRQTWHDRAVGSVVVRR